MVEAKEMNFEASMKRLNEIVENLDVLEDMELIEHLENGEPG